MGANIQEKEQISFGLTSLYLLGIEEVGGEKPIFDDRFNLRVLFSANTPDIFGVEERVDIFQN